MRNMLRSFTSFNRTERMGIVGLLSVSAALLVAKATMHLWVKPHPVQVNDIHVSKALADKIVQPQTSANININTADSATLTSIKGIGPALAHRILERRRNMGAYTSFDEVFSVYHFPEKTKAVLKEAVIFK